MIRTFSLLGLLTAALTSCQNKPSHHEVATVEVPTSKSLMAAMERTANWQIPRSERLDYITFRRQQAESQGQWMMGALYSGLVAVAERSTNPFYEKWIGYKSQEWHWQLGPKKFYADDHLIGSTYIWYKQRHPENTSALKNIRATFDDIIAENPSMSLEFFRSTGDKQTVACQDRWCWADALYMAPPTWFELSVATGDTRYAEYAHKEYQATVDYLYSAELGLMYRDSRFFDMKGQFGEPIFWARGSGWVYGGLVRILEALPKGHTYRPYYEKLYLDMSTSLKKLQKRDGSWAMSLLAKEKIKAPETSGTGFFTFGMAWGLKQGLLPEADYLEPTLRGWRILSDAVHSDGKLGWVQGVSAEPGNVRYEDSQIYGVGAYLLAASQLYDFVKLKELNIKNPKKATFIFEGTRDFVPRSFSGVVFYADKSNDVWAVNAAKENQRSGFAYADMRIPRSLQLKNDFEYTLTLVTLTEVDGESTYQVFCDDKLLSQFTNPRVETDYQEVRFPIRGVNISGCKTLGVASNAHTNGLIPEGKGTAYARGRWRHITLVEE